MHLLPALGLVPRVSTLEGEEVMGNMSAVGMAGAVEEGQVSLKQALTWHLVSNHFPPVSKEWVPVCEKAIEHANAGEWDEVLVSGLGDRLTVTEVVDGLHLHAFINAEGEEVR